MILLLLLHSCNSNKKVKIGFLLPNLTDSRYPKDRDFFVEKITEAGGVVEVGDAHNDPNQQEDQARNMIKDGVKVIVIAAVNQNLAASIVRMSHDKGVKVIAYERLIQNCDLDYFVTFDHYLVGKQQASYAVQRKPEGNYVLLGGDKGDKNAELIKKGQMDIIAPLVKSGKIKILFNVFVEDWSPESAHNDIQEVLNLSGEKVDAVLTANDGMAGGIISTLENQQPGYPVIITGLDADIEACRRIKEGKQSMTVYKPFKNEAQIAADLAMELAKGEKINSTNQTTWNGMVNVETNLLQSVIVDNSNIMSSIVKDGYYNKKELFENKY